MEKLKPARADSRLASGHTAGLHRGWGLSSSLLLTCRVWGSSQSTRDVTELSSHPLSLSSTSSPAAPFSFFLFLLSSSLYLLLLKGRVVPDQKNQKPSSLCVVGRTLPHILVPGSEEYVRLSRLRRKPADGTEVVGQLTWRWGMLLASAGGPDGVTREGSHKGSGRQKREAGAVAAGERPSRTFLALKREERGCESRKVGGL